MPRGTLSAAAAKPAGLTSEGKISPQAQRLLEVLARFLPEGEGEIPQTVLAEAVGMSDRSVRAHLLELKKAGLIDWKRQCRRPNLYRILDRKSLPDKASAQREEGPGDFRSRILSGGHLLLIGEEGIGKTYRLRALSRDGLSSHYDAVIEVQAGPPREFLVRLVSRLMEAGILGPEEFAKPIREYRGRELAELVRKGLREGKVLLLIDDLDRATPTLRPLIAELLTRHNVQVVATATEERKLEGLIDHFFVHELQGLSRSETYGLVERFVRYRRIPVRGGDRGLERLKEYIWSRTKGNPRKIQALLRKVEAQGYVDPRFVREELVVGGRVRFIDMTWTVVLAAAMALAVRYLSLGLHDRLLYVLAGFTYAAFLVLRYLSWRWRRR